IWTRATRARQRHEDVPQQVAPAAAVDLDGLMAEGSVYTAASVDEPAVMQRGSRLPYYPESLYDAGIGGRVLVEFVVIIVGKVEPATVRVVTASEPEFAEAVRSAIVSAEFSSPRIGAARVRQLVQIPFVFQPRPQSQEGSPAIARRAEIPPIDELRLAHRVICLHYHRSQKRSRQK